MRGVMTGAAAITAAAIVLCLVGCASDANAGASSAQTILGGSHESRSAAIVPGMPGPAGAPVSSPSLVGPVKTAPLKASTVSPYCEGTPSGVQHIYVSISKQELYACTGPRLAISTAVTTGASALTNVHDATPTGTWRIYSKVRNTVLAGRDANGSWYDHVKYWMAFYRGYGFHDASWQTFPYGSSLYKTKGSHGCVHVPLSVIAFLYGWAPIGTLVTIRS